jgi:hypothetical protein
VEQGRGPLIDKKHLWENVAIDVWSESRIQLRAVWQVVERHISRHFHVGIGGGDQLYALSSTLTLHTARTSP